MFVSSIKSNIFSLAISFLLFMLNARKKLIVGHYWSIYKIKNLT